MAAIFGLTALLAAPLLVPLWNAKQVSAERAERLATSRALSFSLGPADFARTQVFLPRENALFRNGSGAIFFLGLPLLAGARRGLPAAPPAAAVFSAALWAGLFTLAMSTVFYYLLYLTPLFASLRWPFKNFPVAAFFLLLAAAGGAGFFAALSPAKARLAAGLLWLNLGMQLALLLVPAWRQPFGPHVTGPPGGGAARLAPDGENRPGRPRHHPDLAAGPAARAVADPPRLPLCDARRQIPPGRLRPAARPGQPPAGAAHLGQYRAALPRRRPGPQVRGGLETLSGRYLLVAAAS